MKRYITLILVIFPIFLSAESSATYWEYGIGAGVVHFEHYPGAEQYSTLALPVPTFQYNGPILHANDRDGVQAQFFKSEKVILDISGLGFPPLNSKDNKARKEMEDLGVIAAFGPQLIYLFNQNIEYNFSVFQGVSLGFDRQVTTGTIYQSRFIFAFEDPWLNFSQKKTLTRFFWTSRWADRKFQKVFYEVEPKDVTPERDQYSAEGGLMSHELGVLWQMSWGGYSTYLGLAWTDYSSSANKNSPLHLANEAVTYFVGINYRLGQSNHN